MIQSSDLPMTVLAKRLGVTVQTVARWKHSNSVEDRPHSPHRLQSMLNADQEAIVLTLRKTLDLFPDDLLAVVREFIHPTMSRSALHRMLKRHGVSKRTRVLAPKPNAKPFKADVPGDVHIDVKTLPQMADENKWCYLFVAIDRATGSRVHRSLCRQDGGKCQALPGGPGKSGAVSHSNDRHR